MMAAHGDSFEGEVEEGHLSSDPPSSSSVSAVDMDFLLKALFRK